MSRAPLFAAFAALLLAPAAAWAQASPSPFTSGARYDLAGRVTGTISADPDTVGSGNPFLAVRNSYDQAGRLTKVETGTLSAWQSEAVAPAGWTGFTAEMIVVTAYDAMGRKTREVMSTSGTVRRVTDSNYDDAGRPKCTAVRMNPAIFPDAAGAGGSLPVLNACLPGTQGTGANNFGPDRIVQNFYDAADQRVQLREGVGSADEGAEASWAYNLNGQVTTVIDGNGNQAALVYDGHGRQECWMFPSTTRAPAYNDTDQATALSTMGGLSGTIPGGHCTTGNYERYLTDPAGNRTELRKRDGRRIQFAYDHLNRVTEKTYPDGGATAVYYGYDLRNLQLFARYTSASGQGVTNSYDGFGRLVTSSTNMGGVTRTLAYQYDRDGDRTRITHPDGVAFNYLYDGLDRPTWVQDVASAVSYGYRSWGTVAAVGRVGASSGMVIAPDGRLTSAYHYNGPTGTAFDVIWTFAHNPAGQVTGETRTGDAYAWTGHYAVQRPYTANGRNQYTQTGSGPVTTFGYDDNGNLASETPPSPAPAKTYGYDIENRLVSVSAGGVALSYDPLGRLFQVSSTTGPTTQFLYDGDALVAEYVSGAMTRRYAHGTGADVPVLQYDGATVSAATRHYLLADRQGSIVAVTDGSSTIQTRNAYDEYGIPAASNSGRFQYTGQIWLPELGMYHYKARVYSPTLGRFLQTDPVGYQDQFNLYAYVGNDPLNRTDPSGLYRCGNDEPRCRAFDGVDEEDPWGISNGPRTFAAQDQAGGGSEGILSDANEMLANSQDLARNRLRTNRLRGGNAEEVVIRYLIANGFTILGSQVYVRDTFGHLRIIDILVRTGARDLLGIEVKFGSATRSQRQRSIDENLRTYGGRVVNRNRDSQENLPYGMFVRFPTEEIPVHICVDPCPERQP